MSATGANPGQLPRAGHKHTKEGIMPRDLGALAKERTLASMPQLTKTDERPEDDSDEYEDDDTATGLKSVDSKDLSGIQSAHNTKLDHLHPWVQSLTVSDVESCTELEQLAFPPHERCTREKFLYRLTTCPELALGIFTTAEIDDEHRQSQEPPTPSSKSRNPSIISERSINPYSRSSSISAQSATSSSPTRRKPVMLGHIIGTKSHNRTVTDDDMTLPPSFSPDHANRPSPPLFHSTATNGTSTKCLGHQESGSTLAIHSLAVHPAYQRLGLGRTLMQSYLQRMEAQGVVQRAALIAHDHLIGYYAGMGFKNLGPSTSQFGGGGWYDMARELDVGDQGEGW